MKKTDAQIIDELGGPAKVCELLGYERKGGAERVNNWKARGIPARVRLQHLDLFGSQPDAQPDVPRAKVAVTPRKRYPHGSIFSAFVRMFNPRRKKTKDTAA